MQSKRDFCDKIKTMKPTIRIIDAKDRTEWDEFVTSHPEANFLQSWDFYEFYRSRGNEVVRRIAVEDVYDASDQKVPRARKVVGAYAGVVEAAKRGRHLAIAGGPILDWGKLGLVEQVFADIRAQGKLHHCVFVRVRPQLEQSAESEALMARLGLKKAPMYLSVEFAGVLDLNKTEEELLAGMRQRLRRALRKGTKAGITIAKSTDPAEIKRFYQIELETAARHGFVEFSEDFLTKQFTAFAKNGEAVLYIAKLGEEILAENFMIFYGNEASYHYGVSSELGTKLSGAPLLHLEAMRDARERGIKRYNFWGIVGEDETWHRFYGVSQFKRGFGVDELHYTPAHDLVIRHGRYQLTKIFEKIRKKLRHV